MVAKNRSYSTAFKLQVVRAAAAGDKRPGQLAREFGISDSLLCKWRKAYEAGGEDALTPRALRAQGPEALSLEQQVAALLRAPGLGECGAKKSLAAQSSVAERHAMIQRLHTEQPDQPLRQLCPLLGVSRSWYYAAPAAAQVRAARDADLRDAIEAVLLEFPGYGYRRVTHALVRAGWQVNHKRVLRLMREESLLCHLQRHFTVVTTNSAHGCAIYPNLLADAVLDRRDQAWVADITYIRLPTTFVYLACVLDAFSRRCVGWQLSRRIDTPLTLAALEHALIQRQPSAGWIHHSDRGVQYACTAYLERLGAAGARVSMAAQGNPYDNAKAESFFKTLKREEVYLHEYETFADAQANIGHFIENVYNLKRLHSRLGYRPPAEFEAFAHPCWYPAAELP
jgi:transposase InsO family protein/transposase-like protein